MKTLAQKAKIRPIGENSPNLVTLFVSHDGGFHGLHLSKLCARSKHLHPTVNVINTFLKLLAIFTFGAAT
jgi:hypothetical protein